MCIDLHLVTWNGARYIPGLFASLARQTHRDWHLYIWDNESTDETVAVCRNEAEKFGLPYALSESKTNLGFVGGHNALYARTSAKFFLILNQDLVLEADCVERLAEYIKTHEQCASVAPRLMKMDVAGMIDALGMKMYRSRRVLEQFRGKNWEEIKNNFSSNVLPVFGVSGTLALLRRSAVDDVAYGKNEYFDALYESYKEDVDLAYRLNSRGFESCVLLDVVAYHDRGSGGTKNETDLAAAENKRFQAERVRFHSYKNHLMNLYKNERWHDLLLDFYSVLWYELKKFFWLLIFDWRILKGFVVIWNKRKNLAEKRRHNKKLKNT